MNPVFWRVARRYLSRHLSQAALMVAGITLGVALVVAIDLANGAASRAFDLSTEAVAGRATHQIMGGPDGLPESVYTQLRGGGVSDDGRLTTDDGAHERSGELMAAPIVSDYVSSPQLGDRPIQLLGVDPFAEAPFRSYLTIQPSSPSPTEGRSPASSSDIGRPSSSRAVPIDSLIAFLTQPGAVLLSSDLAEEYGIEVGDVLELDVGGRQSDGVVAGLLQAQDRLSRRALNSLILADIATAQELTGRLGRLDWIDLILPPGTGAPPESLRRLLPADAQFVPAGAQAGALAEMTAAFRTNLNALSLLALVVGMLLIYNSMTFSVVQRRPLFGTLRSLGATRAEVGRMVLSEAAIVGVVGSVLGLGLGVLLGQGAVQLVTQTINDLYYVVTVQGFTVPPLSLFKGALLGIGATLVAAALPAREAASAPPRLALTRSVLEDKARRTVPATALAGILAILLGAGVLAVPTRSLVVSFAGLFLVTIGFALLTPLVTVTLLNLATPASSRIFGVLGRMAPRQVSGALSRTAGAVAALMLAVSVTVGVGLMVNSFRATVDTWLEQTLHSDIYVSAPSLTSTRSSAPLESELIEVVRAWPGIQTMELLRSADVGSPHGQIAVSAVQAGDFTERRIFVSAPGGRDGVRQAVEAGAILVTEALANRLDLPPSGATLTLYTDRGPHDFPVAGIYRDYASSQGTVMMSRNLYRAYWDDDAVTAVSFDVMPGTDAEQLAEALADRLAPIQGVIVRPNAALRAEVWEVFDRAFAITGALQLLAGIVAFIGVLSALLSLQLERAREVGVLRAVGLTVRQLHGVVLLETGLIGALAGLLALPTGSALALILVYVINRRSFGWTLDLHLTPGIFVQAVLLAVVAALLAGIYPALRMGRLMAAEALRNE